MSFEQPLVSVIVPSYNHEPFINECLNSIFKQSYNNIELIVLDDGSSDQSYNVIKSLSKQHNFYFDHHQNMGLPATLNKGLRLAHGKYIAIIASDDIMMLDRIEKQVNYLEQYSDIAVCGGNMLAIDNKSQLLTKQRIKPACTLDFDDLFWRDKGGPPAPTAMIRKSVIDKVGGYDPDIAIEDLYMWLKITNHGYKIAVLNDVFAYYRKHGANSHRNYAWLIDNALKIYSAYRDHPKYKHVVNDFQTSMFVKIAEHDKKLALKLLKRITWFDRPMKTLKGITRLLFKW